MPVTRVLYGLHETFVLFPYARGARRSRLVVRARHLRRVCEHPPVNPAALVLAVADGPMFVGELLNLPLIHYMPQVPKVVSGRALNAIRGRTVCWARRQHHCIVAPCGTVRFESGSQFATRTDWFASDVLLALMEHHEDQTEPQAGGT